MRDYTSICLKAELLTRKFFKTYLEGRDFEAMIAMLHKDITWFGTGVHELCRCYEDAVQLLMTEKESFSGKFSIVEQWYDSIPLGAERCLVFGELNIVEDTEEESLFQMEMRFSVICVMEEKEMKIFHTHVSVADKMQDKDEFVHKKIADSYQILLEEKLQERTHLLKNKTEELERLTKNIYGGVELCQYTEGFPVCYISDGFTSMTGYSIEDIEVLFQGRHIGMLHPDDCENLCLEVERQLKEHDNFSVEYRIMCKDGRTIWVLDKGTLIEEEEKEPLVQCILTDITLRKQQEEALYISNRRYEIALQASGITMFEYNVTNGDLILYEDTAKSYDMPTIIKDGVQTFLKKEIILPSSALEYKQMYRDIHEGAPFAKCYVKARKANGEVSDYELSLTNIFDQEGRPTRAIGVRRNVSEMFLLQKEQEFAKNFLADLLLVFEADITNNKLEYIVDKWQKEMGRDPNETYLQVLNRIVHTWIHPEHQELLLEKLSAEYLMQSVKNDNSLITFSYQCRNKQNVYIWYEATINVVKDNSTGDISIRFYHRDINESKQKEQRAMEEQCLYESMIASATIAYEVNITKNQAIKGHEKWKSLYGIENSSNYSVMIAEFARKGMHPDDGAEFVTVFSRENILREFREEGKKNLSCQYRKKEAMGEYRWVQCTLHLYEDPTNNDVKGFSYVEDIDEQKRKELTLQYSAEHDIMTGIYNKATTEHKIEEYLESIKGMETSHAFLIIDIDHFKTVNDTFGHLFGDDVLKEIAVKICAIFRDNDIIGRIGGDEFCVFMKRISTKEGAIRKASELCKQVCKNYVKDGKTCNISASIGIAFYKEDGTTFNELYQHADKALYQAKEKGRNRYEI